jgi:acetyl-CoA carboxylase biotin carboxyl carrier protein
MEVEWKQIEKLMDRFENANLEELELETGEVKLHLKKESKQAQTLYMTEPVFTNAGQIPAPSLEQERKKSEENLEEKESGKAVKAPLVGTYYAASEPGAEPYVKEGQMVKKGEVLGLIEAMKIMNEILAPCDGKVNKILVENGSFVAYDQVLLTIEE